jgi:hypothetical protein
LISKKNVYSVIIHDIEVPYYGSPMVSMSDADAILQILSAPDASGGLGAPEIRERLQRRGVALSQPTPSRRLSDLQRRGQIVRQGLRRGTRYALDPVALHFSIASERRKPVNYNFTLILEYRPNVTRWLSAAQRERFRGAGERIRALPPARGNTVLERLAIDLSWASSYLEGNTYTLLDTERLLVEGRAAGLDAWPSPAASSAVHIDRQRSPVGRPGIS